MTNKENEHFETLDELIARQSAVKTEIQVELSRQTQEKFEKTAERITELEIKKRRIEEEIERLKKKQERRIYALSQKDNSEER